jgi:hypothetical protein
MKNSPDTGLHGGDGPAMAVGAVRVLPYLRRRPRATSRIPAVQRRAATTIAGGLKSG